MNIHSRLLENFYIDQAILNQKRLFGQSLSPKVKSMLKRSFKKRFSDKELYTDYEIRNGKLLKFIQARLSDNPFDGKFIHVNLIKIIQNQMSKKMLLNELKEVSLYYDNQYPLSIRAIPEDIKIYKKLGFKIKGYWLTGSVSKCLNELRKISNQNPLDGFFENMNYRRDQNKVTDLMINAHAKCDSSMIKFDSIDSVKNLKGHLKKMSQNQSIFIYKVNKEIVGVIGYIQNKDVKRTAIIGSIAVDPKFQGHGISKALYLKVFDDMKSKKIFFFTGISSTDEVIGLSKKMKRNIAFAVMWRDVF